MNAVGDTKHNHRGHPGELRACLLAFLDQFLQEHLSLSLASPSLRMFTHEFHPAAA
ncbi:unnamed protein product, partial [Ectocarpus sp. 6 AP-2014]